MQATERRGAGAGVGAGADTIQPINYSKKTCSELIALCREKGIRGYSGKKKDDLITLLTANQNDE